MKRLFAMVTIILVVAMTGCIAASPTDTDRQLEVARDLEEAQPTPTDLEYSLERYNLIRRAYWVNG